MKSNILIILVSLCLLIMSSCRVFAQGVESRELDKDGTHYVVLENEYVKLVFIPDKGGICGKFEVKNWAGENNTTLMMEGGGYAGGLFDDHFWLPQVSFAGKKYLYEIIDRPGGKSIHLWTRGEGGVMYLELHKTITLYQNSNLVDVIYEFKNLKESYTDYEIGVQFHNFIGLRGEPNTYYFPMGDGVRAFTYDYSSGKLPEEYDHWFNDPVRGWTAVLGKKSQHGMGVLVDYKYLDAFYCWSGLEVATHEWFTRKQVVRQGTSLTVRYGLYPFQGISRVDGVVGGMVCSIEGKDSLSENERGLYEIKVYPAVNKKVKVETRVRRLEENSWEAIHKGEYGLDADKLLTIPVEINSRATGKIIVNTVLMQENDVLGDFERLIIVGNDSEEKYVRKPVEEKVGVGRLEKGSDVSVTQHNLSMEMETPHIKWAKPYHRGKVKVFILTNIYQEREIIELAQRIDMDFDSVKFSLEGDYGYFGDPSIRSLNEARERLLQYLKNDKYDVMVIGGLEWDKQFNEDIHREIEKKVSEGMGLVYISPLGLDERGKVIVPISGGALMGGNASGGKWEKVKSHYLVNGIDFSVFPLSGNCHYQIGDDAELIGKIEDNYPLIAIKDFGKGRVIGLGYDVYAHNPDYKYNWGSGLTPQLAIPDFARRYWGLMFQPDRDLRYNYWEYYFAFLSKCVLWSAKREGPLDIKSFDWTDDGKKLKIVLENPGEGIECKITASLKNKYSEETESIALDKVLAEKGDTQIEIPVSYQGQHGINFAELIVKNTKDESINWGITSRQDKKDKFIEVLRFNKNFSKVGENVDGTLVLDGQGEGDYVLEFKLYDTHGRLLDAKSEERVLLPGRQDYNFSLSSSRSFDEGGLIDARLIKDKVEQDFIKERIAITVPYDPKEFYISGWMSRFGRYYLRRIHIAELKKIGFTTATIDSWEPPSWRPYAYNMDINYAINTHVEPENNTLAKYLETKDKKWLERKPSFSDPEFVEKCKDGLRKAGEISVSYGGALNYGVGDENRLYAWADFGPHSLSKYRQWLQKEYGTIEALNLEWKSDYKVWEEVMPFSEEEARNSKNYASWFTHRIFMEKSLADFYSICLETVKEVDPSAGLHISGTWGDTVEAGTDWLQLTKIFDVKGYNEWWILGEIFRCFLKNRNMPYVYHYPDMWHSIFHGAQGFGNWCAPQLSLYTDYSLTKTGEACEKFVKKAVKNGLYRLIQESKRDNSKIAIHYSRLSRFAAYISGVGENTWEENVQAWTQVLEDMGFQYDLVSYEQLEQDRLQPDIYKVLILPQSMSMYPVEIEKIKTYVASGGTVIADGMTAEVSPHGIKYDNGSLDMVFGVKKGSGERQLVSLKDYQIDINVLDRGIKVNRGKSLLGEGQSVIFLNRYENGKAIYLNFDIKDYSGFRKSKQQNMRVQGYRDLLSKVFNEAGMQSNFKIKSVDSSPIMTEIVPYKNGDAIILGVFFWCKEKSNDSLAEIMLNKDYHVYDIEKGEYLGYKKTIRTIFKAGELFYPSDFRCYALLSEIGNELELQVDKEVKAGDELTFSVSYPYNINRKASVEINLVNPDRVVIPHYCRSVLVSRGEGWVEGKVKLALNDKSGMWKIIARDIFTGAEKEIGFEVRQR